MLQVEIVDLAQYPATNLTSVVHQVDVNVNVATASTTARGLEVLSANWKIFLPISPNIRAVIEDGLAKFHRLPKRERLNKRIWLHGAADIQYCAGVIVLYGPPVLHVIQHTNGLEVRLASKESEAVSEAEPASSTPPQEGIQDRRGGQPLILQPGPLRLKLALPRDYDNDRVKFSSGKLWIYGSDDSVACCAFPGLRPDIPQLAVQSGRVFDIILDGSLTVAAGSRLTYSGNVEGLKELVELQLPPTTQKPPPKLVELCWTDEALRDEANKRGRSIATVREMKAIQFAERLRLDQDRKAALSKIVSIASCERSLSYLEHGDGHQFLVPVDVPNQNGTWLSYTIWEDMEEKHATYVFLPRDSDAELSIRDFVYDDEPAKRSRLLRNDEDLKRRLGFAARVIHNNAGANEADHWWERLRLVLGLP